jgi:hypothetical protein
VKYLIVTAPEGYRDTVQAVLDGTSLKEIWWETSPSTNDTFSVRLVCDAAEETSLMSSLQKALAGTDKGSIHALNIDSTFPNPKPLFEAPQLSREELFRIADQGARSDSLYLLLVGLSTVVAAIGLLQNNVAVIIGAMVIAPLLGPNLSIALGSALGIVWISCGLSVCGSAPDSAAPSPPGTMSRTPSAADTAPRARDTCAGTCAACRDFLLIAGKQNAGNAWALGDEED